MTNHANVLRKRALRLTRAYKDVFRRAVTPRRWLYRWLFTGENGELTMMGEAVLADLRGYARLNPNQFEAFDSDEKLMAYRAGKQAVVRRIFFFLNLDEALVQKLMEIDDGL